MCWQFVVLSANVVPPEQVRLPLTVPPQHMVGSCVMPKLCPISCEYPTMLVERVARVGRDLAGRALVAPGPAVRARRDAAVDPEVVVERHRRARRCRTARSRRCRSCPTTGRSRRWSGSCARAACTGRSTSGCVSWMPYEISWNMCRCDDPGAADDVHDRRRVRARRLPMSNIIAAIVRGDLDGAVIKAPCDCLVDRTRLIDVARRLLELFAAEAERRIGRRRQKQPSERGNPVTLALGHGLPRKVNVRTMASPAVVFRVRTRFSRSSPQRMKALDIQSNHDALPPLEIPRPRRRPSRRRRLREQRTRHDDPGTAGSNTGTAGTTRRGRRAPARRVPRARWATAAARRPARAAASATGTAGTSATGTAGGGTAPPAGTGNRRGRHLGDRHRRHVADGDSGTPGASGWAGRGGTTGTAGGMAGRGGTTGSGGHDRRRRPRRHHGRGGRRHAAPAACVSDGLGWRDHRRRRRSTAAPTATVVENHGPPANRVNYIILGDGFTPATAARAACSITHINELDARRFSEPNGVPYNALPQLREHLRHQAGRARRSAAVQHVRLLRRRQQPARELQLTAVNAAYNSTAGRRSRSTGKRRHAQRQQLVEHAAARLMLLVGRQQGRPGAALHEGGHGFHQLADEYGDCTGAGCGIEHQLHRHDRHRLRGGQLLRQPDDHRRQVGHVDRLHRDRTRPACRAPVRAAATSARASTARRRTR